MSDEFYKREIEKWRRRAFSTLYWLTIVSVTLACTWCWIMVDIVKRMWP